MSANEKLSVTLDEATATNVMQTNQIADLQAEVKRQKQAVLLNTAEVKWMGWKYSGA